MATGDRSQLRVVARSPHARLVETAEQYVIVEQRQEWHFEEPGRRGSVRADGGQRPFATNNKLPAAHYVDRIGGFSAAIKRARSARTAPATEGEEEVRPGEEDLADAE